jgi:hypothetical protein
MTKRKIKIVKRDAPIPQPTPVPESPADTEKDMTNTVKNWITERRENSEAEKDSNTRQIFDWTTLPDTSGKPA